MCACVCVCDSVSVCVCVCVCVCVDRLRISPFHIQPVTLSLRSVSHRLTSRRLLVAVR